MDKKINISPLLLSFLIILLLLFTSYSIYSYFFESKDNSITEQLEESPTNEDVKTPDQYEGWEKYESETYDISLRYGPDWVIEDEDSFLRVVPKDSKEGSTFNKILVITKELDKENSLDGYALAKEEEASKNDNLFIFQNVQMWNKDAILFYTDSNPDIQIWGYLVKAGDYFYTISFSGLAEDSKILNSIEFNQ